MNRKVLGKRLREERVRLGLTQEQTAEYIGVSTAYVGMVERGERAVTLERLIQFAECLHVTIDYLLQDSLPVSDTQKTEQLMALWSRATETEQSIILSIAKTVVGHNNDDKNLTS